MIESTGSMGRTATYAEEFFVAEIERLRKALSASLQERERFKQRCWSLALLLYPEYPQGAPREAVAGDLGLQEPQSAEQT